MQNKLTNTVRRPLNRVNVFTLTACIAVMGLASVPAQANVTPTDTVTTLVESDLLNTKNGAKRVYDKLERRADRACKTRGPQSLRDRVLGETCATDLLNDFVVNLNDERVTAVHQKTVVE